MLTIDTVKTFAKANASKILVALGVLGYAGVKNLPESKPLTAAQAVSPSTSTTEAQRIEFTVQGGKKFPSFTLLNSSPDYKSPDNVTVYLDTKSKPELGSVDPQSLKGRTITIWGTRGEYKGKPQIVAQKVEVK